VDLGGSRPSSFFGFLNSTTESASKVKTTMNMAPVTATKIDNPKIDCAGVEAGANMFVGLNGAPAVRATAGAEQNITRKVWTPAHIFEFLPSHICS
jgi:hypothetical protein